MHNQSPCLQAAGRLDCLMPQAMSILALLWIIWCALHSLLITEQAQTWIARQNNWLTGTYRIFYIFFSLLTLIPIIIYQYSFPQKVLFAWHGWWRLPQLLLLSYAFVMFWQGSKNYDVAYFLGIRQWRNQQNGQTAPPLEFRCQGIGLYVRHPWYSGGLALLWAVGPITDINLTSRLILSAYLFIGTLLEERKLRHQLGEPYQQYCQHVPMLFPWKGRVSITVPDQKQTKKKERNLL